MIKIEITSKHLLIQGNAFVFPIPAQGLEKILGISRVVQLKFGTKFTWDKAGIIGHSTDGIGIDNIYICYQAKDYAFSPTHTFSGELLVLGEDVRKYRQNNMNNLLKTFKGDTGGKFVFAEISCWYDMEEDHIGGVELQKDDGTVVQIPMRQSREHPILIDDKFDYLIGLWEVWKNEIIKTVPIDNEYFNLKYGITESEATQYAKIADDIFLPDELIAFYKIYNTEYDAVTSAFNFTINGFWYYLLPIEHIKSEWENIQALQFGDDLEQSNLENFSDKVKATDYTNPRWIPFAEGKNGDYLMYDTDPGLPGTYGQIIELQNESWERNVVAGSLSELLQQEIDLLAKGETEKFNFIIKKD